MSRDNGHDALFKICYQLLRIDNRPHKEIAEETELSIGTIRRLRQRKGSFMRTTSVTKLVTGMNKVVIVQDRRRGR